MPPFSHATETYTALGVDVKAALTSCDTGGFENAGMILPGAGCGHGNYPGKARNLGNP